VGAAAGAFLRTSHRGYSGRMTRRALFAIAVSLPAAIGAFVACSSDDDAGMAAAIDGSANDGANTVDSAPPPTERSSCIAYIEAFCEKSAACVPGGGGLSLRRCLENTALCPEYFFAPGSTRTIEGMLECAEGFRRLSCHEYLAGRRPPCATPGTLAEGEPCISPAQCRSSSCNNFSAGLSCGTCGRLFGPDEDCSSGFPGGPVSCQIGDRCDPVTHRCATIPAGAPAGSSCNTMTICATDVCAVSAPAATEGTCEALPGPGSPCVLSLDSTNARCAKDAFCKYSNPERSTGTCAAFAKEGEPCGTPAGESYDTPCEASFCKRAPQELAGICAAFVPLDGACSDASACGPTAYCYLTAPGVGVCRPLAKPGEACGVTNSGGTSFVVPCESDECSFSQDASVCLSPRVGRGGDCTAPNTACYNVLSCTDGTCTAIDYASCPAPDAGVDGGDAGDAATD
jgi:hypothetical protein